MRGQENPIHTTSFHLSKILPKFHTHTHTHTYTHTVLFSLVLRFLLALPGYLHAFLSSAIRATFRVQLIFLAFVTGLTTIIRVEGRLRPSPNTLRMHFPLTIVGND
jgi:hypothetical protein